VNNRAVKQPTEKWAKLEGGGVLADAPCREALGGYLDAVKRSGRGPVPPHPDKVPAIRGPCVHQGSALANASLPIGELCRIAGAVSKCKFPRFARPADTHTPRGRAAHGEKIGRPKGKGGQYGSGV